VPDDPALAPVARLDARTFVQLVNDYAGADLELLGPAPRGQVGAAFVRWPDGREGVLTRGHGTAGEVRQTADILRLARSRGLPVPLYELVTEVPGAVAIVQERLPGQPPERAARHVVEAMVALIDRCRGLLVDRVDVPPPDLHLRRSGPGFSVHESLAAYSPRTVRLLAWVREVGKSSQAAMDGDDLVHLDFHPENVLVDEDGTITGIVDWDGVARGDRRFMLVTLRFSAAPLGADPDTVAWLDRLIDAWLDRPTLRAYWAAMSLRQVDWAIRHFGPAEVERDLTLAESRIPV
jgi:aminoglycoside phosphotransferase (APT) family kinase protein